MQDKPTWNKLYKATQDHDEFNKKAAEERKNKNMKEIIAEWENSFTALINRIKKLSDVEWNHFPSMHSLFRYEEGGKSDEGRHAEQVKKFFVKTLLFSSFLFSFFSPVTFSVSLSPYLVS